LGRIGLTLHEHHNWRLVDEREEARVERGVSRAAAAQSK
jgi:hypothetical protein